MEAAVYRVKPGYVIHLPHQVVLKGGDLFETDSFALVRDHLWKLTPVSRVPASSPNPLPVPQKPEGVSVIIPAWKAGEFIQECLDSLVAQTHFVGGAEYEILLGIDACKSTRKQVLKVARHYEHLHIYWFGHNYGPYLVKNSLAAQAQFDRLLFFDADDIAEPHMVESLLAPGHVRSAVYFMGQEMQAGQIKQTCGVFLIRKRDFLEMGGFMPWRCAADTEFMRRLPAAEIGLQCSPEVLMLRRVHDNQITVKPDTGFGSDLRACYMAQIKQIVRLGIANIGLVTAKSERII